MTCEQARELLAERETRALQSLLEGVALEPGDEPIAAHLAGCPSCRALADQILKLDASVSAHVEAFAERGDFAQEWAEARATVSEIRRRPIHRTFFGIASLAALLLFVARTALLPLTNLPLPSPPRLDLPPVASPALPNPPALPVAPAPAPEPAAAPPAAAKPPRTPSPRPVRAPKPAEPKPSPPLVPPSPAEGPARTVTVEIDPAVRAARLQLACPSSRLPGRRSGSTFTFQPVPSEPCALEVDGVSHPGVSPGLDRYRLVSIGGKIVLVGS